MCIFTVSKLNKSYNLRFTTMKTYNKSKIMKEAHYWKKVLGYTMSESMKMACRNAKSVVKRNEEAKAENEAYDKMYAERAANTNVCDMSYMANTLTNYYSSNGYKAD